ncbi:MAG: polysaccharide lyase family 7 protein [Algibacter sp.]
MKKILNLTTLILLLIFNNCAEEEVPFIEVESESQNENSTNLMRKSSKSKELSYNNLTASTQQSTNPISNIDDSGSDYMSTRWSGHGTSASVYIDFGSIVTVDYVNIAFFKGNTRTASFSYWSSSDGISWNYKGSKNSAGNTEDHEEFDLANMDTRYFRIKFQGNSINDWNSVLDLQVFGSNGDTITPTPPNGNLDPNKAPSENFDLSKWKITLSSGDETSVADLNDGFTYNNQFYTNTTDGGMVFKNYPKGAGTTTNSTYSRVEFREMLRGENTNISTKGVNGNNWVFSSSSSSNESAAGGVDGVLTATLSVNRVTTTSDSDTQLGRIVIGQIHASGNEPCRLYYKKMSGDSKGAIYFGHEDSDGDETFVNIIGNFAKETGSGSGDYTGASQPSNGIPLGEVFSYKIEVVANMLYVHIYRDGEPDVSEEYNMSNSGYANDWMYFKAGLYSQNKTVQSSSDYEQVTFYALKQSHN